MRLDWVGKGIHLEMCKKFKFDLTNKWYMHNPEPVLENDTQTPFGIWHTNWSPNLGQTTRRNNNQQQKTKRELAKLWTLLSRLTTIKLKQCEKKDKYLDLARELKKLWNTQVTIIPIMIGVFGTVSKGLLKGLENLEVVGRVKTIQTTALLRMARILRRVLEIWGDWCQSNSSERPSAKADVKKL